MNLKSHRDLRVYQSARKASLEVFHVTKLFPATELYNLTKQILRSSRSVRANLAEAWRRRRTKDYFVSKLNDVETEACETQEWVLTAYDCGYLDADTRDRLHDLYDHILAQVHLMATNPEKWVKRV